MLKAQRLLLTVTDTFDIAHRGLVIAPDVDLGERVQVTLDVELRRPDGSAWRGPALAQLPLVSGPVRQRRGHVLCFSALSKQEVPIGTEVWVLGEGESV